MIYILGIIVAIILAPAVIAILLTPLGWICGAIEILQEKYENTNKHNNR